MAQAKQPSKRKRRSKALPVIGAAGLSLSLVSTASAVPGGPAVSLPTSGNGDGKQIFLGEEEISDVSLATFYVFEKEGDGASSMLQLVAHGGCGGCHGWGGCDCWRGWGGMRRACRLRRWLQPRLRLPWLRRMSPRLQWLRLCQLLFWWLRRLRRLRRRVLVLD